MITPDELRAERAELEAEVRSIKDQEPTEERTARLDEIIARFDAIDEELPKAERRQAVLERAEAVDAKHGEQPELRAGYSAPNFIRKPEAMDVAADRSATPQQLADAITRSLEDKVEGTDNQTHTRKLLQRHRGDTDWARGLLVRSSETYESAFSKVISGRSWDLSPEERTALSTVTSANGDYLVPTHLDPTVILSNSGTSNAVRAISRVVTLTRPGDTSWQGITSAGVTASFDAQLAEVSDDSPTFAQPSIPVHKAQAFVQASIEATEDISGLAGELLAMFADARDRLEGAAHCTGTGSDQPTGIFTALDANTNVEIVSDTAAAIFKADLDELYRSVPVRFRGNAKWLMHPIWALAVQNLGTAVSANYSTDLTQAPTMRILGKEVVESDDAPSVATTTVRDNEIVFGDFSNYVIVDKPGSFGVKYVDVMFNTSNNLPDGRVGWYAYWRTGADSVVDTAFRVLQDKTSA